MWCYASDYSFRRSVAMATENYYRKAHIYQSTEMSQYGPSNYNSLSLSGKMTLIFSFEQQQQQQNIAFK